MKDSEFDNLLNAARSDVPLPHSFQQGVWHRIECSMAEQQPVLSYFASPWAPALGVAATVAVGLWLGAVSIPETKDATTTYAESISPFAHAQFHGK